MNAQANGQATYDQSINHMCVDLCPPQGLGKFVGLPSAPTMPLTKLAGSHLTDSGKPILKQGLTPTSVTTSGKPFNRLRGFLFFFFFFKTSLFIKYPRSKDLHPCPMTSNDSFAVLTSGRIPWYDVVPVTGRIGPESRHPSRVQSLVVTAFDMRLCSAWPV